MQKLEIIKVYDNRKLYSKLKQTYVNIGDIRESLREGRDVQIIEHRTQRDVTQERLAAAYGYTMKTDAKEKSLEEVKVLFKNTEAKLPCYTRVQANEIQS